MLGKIEFSAEKVLKNRFFKKFRGKGFSAEKNVRKIGPWMIFLKAGLSRRFISQAKNSKVSKFGESVH
jgi:hypothetical protein